MADQEFTTEELAAEEWRDVVGYETWYQVSDLGRVRRVAPRCNSVRVIAGKYPRILKPQMRGGCGNGRYRHVTLHRGPGCASSKKIALLVMAAFVGPLPEGKEVNHIDENKINDRLLNLEYLTHMENLQHSIARFPRGETHGNAKLSAEDVRDIRRRFAVGESIHSITRRFPVDRRRIQFIVRNTAWLHV